MQFMLSSFLAMAPLALAATEVHGEGNLGASMGPVDFMWPTGRAWSADADNTSPCGSVEGPTDRTEFPLTQGSVSLSIADDAWNVEFYIAVDDNPTSMSDFQQQVVQDIATLEPGHQCYKLRNMPSNIAPGTPATLQMRYWAEYDGELNGQEQNFYACADIVFAETIDAPGACFNVTSGEFALPESTPAATPDTGAAGESTPSSSGALSGGAKAGIAVGTVVGSLAVVGLVAFLVLRRRKSATPSPEDRPKDIEEIS